ncbi:unnamed protein product [Heligmosomoides polygyrus]|uniref:DUF2063 domain-containing protein n=1 Tax=Heligmosomoides polygyrus TaxID=6339 RepID=A0A183G214_HELPZ|nr:unnamed protein product [Heligmosomoides polygyrus]
MQPPPADLVSKRLWTDSVCARADITAPSSSPGVAPSSESFPADNETTRAASKPKEPPLDEGISSRTDARLGLYAGAWRGDHPPARDVMQSVWETYVNASGYAARGPLELLAARAGLTEPVWAFRE